MVVKELTLIQNRAEFSYNDDRHEYLISGKPLLNVSTILSELGFSDYSGIPEGVMERARVRGKYVHMATAYLDKGVLNWDTVDPEIRGYVEGYQRFRDETDFNPMVIEEPMYSRNGYAGTPDRLGTLFGDLAIGEVKTWVKSNVPYCDLQIAGYRNLAMDSYHEFIPGARGFEIQLFSDGRYKLREVEDLDEKEDLFIAALRIARFKRR